MSYINDLFWWNAITSSTRPTGLLKYLVPKMCQLIWLSPTCSSLVIIKYIYHHNHIYICIFHWPCDYNSFFTYISVVCLSVVYTRIYVYIQCIYILFTYVIRDIHARGRFHLSTSYLLTFTPSSRIKGHTNSYSYFRVMTIISSESWTIKWLKCLLIRDD